MLLVIFVIQTHLVCMVNMVIYIHQSGSQIISFEKKTSTSWRLSGLRGTRQGPAFLAEVAVVGMSRTTSLSINYLSDDNNLFKVA